MTDWMQWLSEVEIIDLSVVLSEEFPSYWPPVLGYKATQLYDIEHYGFFIRTLHVDEHAGTHFDAPAHFIPPESSGLPHAGPASSITAEKVPVRKMIGPACVVDARDLIGQAEPGEHPAIDLTRIKDWEAVNGSLRPEEIVIFRTGWTDLTYKPFPEGNQSMLDCVVLRKTPAWPQVTREAMEYLADRGIRAAATDGVSIGDFEAHRIGLGRGLIFFERLIHLDRLPTRGALFIFLPIAVAGGSGAPGRAVAIVEKAL